MKRDIESDPEIQKYATSIVLQSRLKTAPSAFKKMVKGAKQRDELFDLLGLRIIITERDDGDGCGRSRNHPDEDAEEDDQVRVHVDITEDEVISSSTTAQQEDEEEILKQQQLVPSSAKLFREKQAIYRMEVLLNR